MNKRLPTHTTKDTIKYLHAHFAETAVWPVSFICGRKMIELFGVKEPDEGMVFYLCHIGDGLDWLPDIPVSHRIVFNFLPVELSFEDHIADVLTKLKERRGVQGNVSVAAEKRRVAGP